MATLLQPPPPTDAFGLLPKAQLARRRSALLRRIRAQFEIVEVPMSIGPLRLNFTRVKDPNVVLDEICAAEDRLERSTGKRHNGNDLHLPYWAELWESSVGVGEFLAREHDKARNHDKVTRWQGDMVKERRDKVKERRGASSHLVTPSPCHLVSVLDLGCGMGLAGTVAAAMGHRVLLADIETPALLFARLNTLPYSNRVRVRRLNWQMDSLGERFDLILGADVLYERAQWEYLEPFWRAHLSENGAVLLGEPGRQTGDLFGEWIAHRGWTLDLFEQPVAGRRGR